MSLEIVRHVHAQHPELLAENLGRTCHQFTLHVIDQLRAADHFAFLMCKTRGEGQYIPLGFQPRDVIGLDGKTYRCTGVSHDAIWCDGKQFDTIIAANESDHPLIVDGKRVHASPTWHEIPERYWRPQNPPLRQSNTTIPTPGTNEPTLGVMPKGEAFAALQALNAFYAAPEGLQRPGGLTLPDRDGRMVADMEAIAQWFYQIVIERVPLDAVFTQIRNSEEYKSKHPNGV